jgi:tetratricopeptide (TPR) repeat protein
LVAVPDGTQIPRHTGHDRLVDTTAGRRQDGQAAVDPECDLIARLEAKEPDQIRFRADTLWRLCDRSDASLADYTRAITMAPAWADAYKERGDVLRSERRFPDALADYNKVLELAPKWADGFRTRAARVQMPAGARPRRSR